MRCCSLSPRGEGWGEGAGDPPAIPRAAAIAVESSHKVAAQRETAGAASEAAASAATKRFPMIGIAAQSQVLSKIGEVIPTVGAPIQNSSYTRCDWMKNGYDHGSQQRIASACAISHRRMKPGWAMPAQGQASGRLR